MSSEEKPVGFHDKPMSVWQRLPHRSDTGGVSPMMLQGREMYQNERMRGMTPEIRARRKQWLEDQKLSPREPVEVPEIYYHLNNPFRRALNWPFLTLEQLLKPVAGPTIATHARIATKVLSGIVLFAYAFTYFNMFHLKPWYKFSGFRLVMNKPLIYPGEPDYPFTSSMQPDDFASLGFKDSIFYKSEEQIRAEESKKA